VINQLSKSGCSKLIPFLISRLPDGELEFSSVKSKLEHNLLTMLKNSCLSAMQNHLLLRDLRIGKLGDAVDGFECIRRIYRELQRRIRSGEKVILGATSEEMKLYMATKAGLTISSAESILTACKILDIEKTIRDTTDSWDSSDSDEPFLELKRPIPINKWAKDGEASRVSSETDLQVAEVGRERDDWERGTWKLKQILRSILFKLSSWTANRLIKNLFLINQSNSA